MKELTQKVINNLYRTVFKVDPETEPLMYRVELFKQLLGTADKDYFKDKRILEIGPKDGLDSLRLADLEPKELVMIDLPEKRDGNDQWLNKLKCNNKYIEANLMYMSEEEIQSLGKFDLIWFTGVLYHNAEQMRLLRKLFKFLNVGGFLAMETATLRSSFLLKNKCLVEVHYPETFKNTGTITHLPSKRAVKAWLKMVGFNEIHDSACYKKYTPILMGHRYACICKKNDNDEAKSYYQNSGLNPKYQFGDSV